MSNPKTHPFVSFSPKRVSKNLSFYQLYESPLTDKNSERRTLSEKSDGIVLVKCKCWHSLKWCSGSFMIRMIPFCFLCFFCVWTVKTQAFDIFLWNTHFYRSIHTIHWHPFWHWKSWWNSKAVPCELLCGRIKSSANWRQAQIEFILSVGVKIDLWSTWFLDNNPVCTGVQSLCDFFIFSENFIPQISLKVSDFIVVVCKGALQNFVCVSEGGDTDVCKVSALCNVKILQKTTS